MRISIVAAASANNVIGRNGELPWHISEDLRHFKAVTLGHPVIMGRRTWESIGRPLPGRRNIVITTRADYQAEGCELAASPAHALRIADDAEEVMVIGGGQVYELFMQVAERIILTRIDADFDGDTYFPELNPAEWRMTARETFPAGPGRDFGFAFETYERISAGNRED